MLETRSFSESATAVDKSSGKWRVLALKQGLSKNKVNYGQALLESDMPKRALPANTLMHANHNPEAPSTGGDINTIAGKLISEPIYIMDEGLYADVQIDPKYRQFVEDYKDSIGLSINVRGEAEDMGDFKEALAMLPDPYNSLDLVIAPGAGGKFAEQLQEDFKKASEGSYLREDGSAPAATDSSSKRETKLEISEIKSLLESTISPLMERLDALDGKVAEFQSFSESVLSRLPEPAVVAEAEAAFEAGAQAKEAGLSEAAIKRIKEAGSTNFSEALTREIAIRDEYAPSKTTELGGFSESFVAGKVETIEIPSAWAVRK